MNVKTILNILSALLTIMGLSMLFPAFVSWLYNEPDLLSFLYSSGITLFFGLPIWFFTRKNRKLRNKDGFAILRRLLCSTCCWMCMLTATRHRVCCGCEGVHGCHMS